MQYEPKRLSSLAKKDGQTNKQTNRQTNRQTDRQFRESNSTVTCSSHWAQLLSQYKCCSFVGKTSSSDYTGPLVDIYCGWCSASKTGKLVQAT